MTCPGCRVKDKQCTFLKKHCERLLQHTVTYCFECPDFPCHHLKALDDRYQRNYHMSMIDNLRFIRDLGAKAFLKKERNDGNVPPVVEQSVCIRIDAMLVIRNPQFDPFPSPELPSPA